LDGPELPLFRGTVEGHRNRFKLRMRSYSDDPKAPIFCEVKRRVDRIVRKVRVRVERALAEQVVQGEVPLTLADPRLAEFVEAQHSTGALPLVRVRYEREAYESSAQDPVRMTFDSALSYAPFDPAAPFRLHDGAYQATPLPATIVELKFTDRCPSWMTRIVDELQLCRESIPKYVLCVQHGLRRGSLGLDPDAAALLRTQGE